MTDEDLNLFRRAEQIIRNGLAPRLRSLYLRDQDTINITLVDRFKELTAETTVMASAGVLRVELLSRQTSLRQVFDMVLPIRQDTITVTGFMEAKKHPPYPLIGIEWEPQLTLLNYPNMPIDVSCRLDGVTCYKVYNCDTAVFEMALKIPLEYHGNTDNTNLEFRTEPVKIEDLPEAIKTEQDKMESLVQEIAKALGPTGIFLPALPCTKHVNVSMPEWNTEMFKYNGTWKNGEHGGRFHINVGYGFSEYGKLLKAELLPEDRWCRDDKPILLGYSMAGDDYVGMSNLI